MLEALNFLPWLFDYVEKWIDKKANVNFKIYDVQTRQQIINTYIVQYLKKLRQSDN